MKTARCGVRRFTCGRGAKGGGLLAEGFVDSILFRDGQLESQINYHGMKPANIDALAREAARVA